MCTQSRLRKDIVTTGTNWVYSILVALRRHLLPSLIGRQGKRGVMCMRASIAVVIGVELVGKSIPHILA